LLQSPPALGKEIILSGRKKLLSRVTYVLIELLLCLGLGELALRFLPLGKYRSGPFRQYDPVIGLSLIPYKHLVHSRGCFQGEVSINRWGMRDRERTLEKPPGEFRIAMIGDSAVEAVQVKPDELVNIRMEQLLRDSGYNNVEVMNFAVEGIGTTQELLLYKEKVRPFHPDLVLLMFSSNDVFNNSSTLQPKVYGIHDWYCPYFDLAPDGELVFKPVEPRRFNKLRSYLESHSLLVYYLERVWFSVDITRYTWGGLRLYYGTYSDDPLDEEWRQAWQVTGKVLGMMRDTVTADGARFMVLAWPFECDIDQDCEQRLIKQYGRIPPSFKPFKPEQRLKEIADTGNIALDFLAPYMQAYRDQHHLQWPYFGFTCDPHYTALGHEVAAEAVIQRLEEHQLLPPLAGKAE
jgi:lysophospholipase L1-like esterase